MNHKWKDNVCCKCGVKRKRYYKRKLMAIVNHPPWEAYKSETGWAFSFNGSKWNTQRPECKILNDPAGPQGNYH